jgi:hypothetical protein
MWYGSLTPDKEFPKEVRRVLNTAFGELAGRARKTDLKGMLLRCVPLSSLLGKRKVAFHRGLLFWGALLTVPK